MTRALFAQGTLAWCPTVITAPTEVLRHCLGVLSIAAADPEIGGHILGIHLEGPFISPRDGALGAHPRTDVLEPDCKAFDRFQEWAGGKIRILTLAPERPGAEALIRHVTAQGVLVALGHHLADDAVLERAVGAGARLCTHLGNGMPNMIHRHDNALWWQLACDELAGMFITDGHHLPADLIKVALRAKGVDRFLVTSDASPLAGMPPGRYTIFGGLPVVVNEAGRIYSEHSQGLAGSHATMLACMNHLAAQGLLSETELWRVGAGNQLDLLGLDVADLPTAEAPKVMFEGDRFVLVAR
jgi:N-acetylglucosamine-6-phosphate deacetylase